MKTTKKTQKAQGKKEKRKGKKKENGLDKNGIEEIEQNRIEYFSIKGPTTIILCNCLTNPGLTK